MSHLTALDLDVEYLADFCRRNGITRMALFGSRLHGTARPDSDLDLLVEFDPACKVSLFDVGGMSVELSDHFGVQVDLRTPEDLSRYFRDKVVRSAKVLYAA